MRRNQRTSYTLMGGRSTEWVSRVVLGRSNPLSPTFPSRTICHNHCVCVSPYQSIYSTILSPHLFFCLFLFLSKCLSLSFCVSLSPSPSFSPLASCTHSSSFQDAVHSIISTALVQATIISHMSNLTAS